MITKQDSLFIKVLFEMIENEVCDTKEAYARLVDYMKVYEENKENKTNLNIKME